MSLKQKLMSKKVKGIPVLAIALVLKEVSKEEYISELEDILVSEPDYFRS